MVRAGEFLGAGVGLGYGFYVGVPCSFLTPLINRVISDPGLDYVGAASDGEAVAIAGGAWLAGRKTVAMCQNSGLGNMINPLTSLNWPFRIPSLLVVTWRGQPGLKDEPQHELMGQVTQDLLRVVKIKEREFPKTEAEIAVVWAEADAHMQKTGLPFALILEKDGVAEEELKQTPLPLRSRGEYLDARHHAKRLRRFDFLEKLLALLPERAAVIATTGKCGRELFTLADRPQHIYQVGSMGGASAMGLGVALNSKRPVVVLDGDGAALMKMGNFATIGAYAPHNLVHIIFDNEVHDSTGGQATVSANADFARVAQACGYARGLLVDDLPGFEMAIKTSVDSLGPHLIHLKVNAGSLDKLGRPTIKPHEVALRFKDFLQG